MTNEEFHDRIDNLIERFKQFETNPKDVPGMIYSVYNDGEVALEKCLNGKLLGLRTLHCVLPCFSISLPKEMFPNTNGHHGWVYCKNNADASIVREIIKNNLFPTVKN